MCAPSPARCKAMAFPKTPVAPLSMITLLSTENWLVILYTLTFKNSKGYPSFPRDKIILIKPDCFGHNVSTGNFNDEFQHFFSGLLDGFFPGNYTSCIHVDDIRHFFGKFSVGRNLDDRRDWISRGRAKTSG